jgi:hypothetical protein
MKFLALAFILLLPVFAAQAQSSQEFRAKQKYEVTGQLGYNYHMFQTQIGAGIFLDQDNVLGVKLGESSGGEDYQFSGAVQLKHFLNGSFYITPEIYYLNFSEGEFLFWNDDYDRSVSIGAQVRIGNQWQWENFTMGCDWFGIGRDVIFFNRYGDDRKTTLALVNFYLGYSF